MTSMDMDVQVSPPFLVAMAMAAAIPQPLPPGQHSTHRQLACLMHCSSDWPHTLTYLEPHCGANQPIPSPCHVHILHHHHNHYNHKQVVYLVNSGSEANDLALRIALAAVGGPAAVPGPGAAHVAVMAGAYHGHLSSLIPLSPYKFWGPGGGGRPTWVHVLPAPDMLRHAGRPLVVALVVVLLWF